MRIVCISASQVPSSAANSIEVMKVCQALAQCGHEVRLFLPGNQPKPWGQLADFYGLKDRFDIEWLPANVRWKRYDFSMAAVQKAMAMDAQAVYVWPLQAAVFALIWRLPVLLELHGYPEGKLGPLLFRIFLSLPGRKRLLPITQALAHYLNKVYRLPNRKSEVVITPNGVDLNRYYGLPSPSAARQELGLPNLFTASYTGHLYAGRGIGLLVELAQALPRVQFLWVGGRPEDVKTWQERIDSAGITNIRICGFVDNYRLPLYQAAGDVLLMPYERQISGSGGGNSADYCSPMKMFEYMACGRAILSSDLPVIREVLNDTNSLLCTPEDLPAWIKALQSLSNDPLQRQELARQAQIDVQKFTWVERARRALADFSGKESSSAV